MAILRAIFDAPRKETANSSSLPSDDVDFEETPDEVEASDEHPESVDVVRLSRTTSAAPGRVTTVISMGELPPLRFVVTRREVVL